jgi:ferredoxin
MSVQFYRDGKLISDVDCFQGLNLLAHAQIEELETGSECGGHGKCGKDRILISESDQKKLNAPTFIETRHLTLVELSEGWRLACQAFPNVDGLSITVLFK